MDSAFYSDLTVELAGADGTAALSARVRSNEATTGPWAEGLQHGGPPNALLVLVAEKLAAVALGRADLTAVRLAAEFIGPVPVAPLVVSARVERRSRTAVLIAAELGTADRVALQSRIWLLAPGEAPPPAAGQAWPAAERPAVPAIDPRQLPDFGFIPFPYARHLDWRRVHGSPYEPGPAACWVSTRVPLVAGEKLSGLQRTALFADSASGISAELSWTDWSFANIDLDLHLFRNPVGYWLLVDASTQLGAGVAVTRSEVSDSVGTVGSGAQTLLIRRP